MVNIYKIDYEEIKKNILSLNKTDYLVIKSNAYGFGFKNVLDVAYKCGMRKFCVLKLKDAIYIKNKYPNVLVLMLGPFDCNKVNTYRKYDLIVTITKDCDFNIIGNSNISYQIEINSGMNRFGLNEINISDFINDINFIGIYSHNATNYIEHINEQLQYFFDRVKYINNKDIHFASTSTKDLSIPFTSARRIGCDIYKNSLKVYAKIIHINYCLKDSFIGYDYSYKLDKDSYIGVIDIGYADGLERNCDGFLVYIKNAFFPLLGKACMNHAFVLLDDETYMNHEVIIIGKENKLNNYVNYFKKIPHEVYLSFLKRY